VRTRGLGSWERTFLAGLMRKPLILKGVEKYTYMDKKDLILLKPLIGYF
jgi:hypothetical protein